MQHIIYNDCTMKHLAFFLSLFFAATFTCIAQDYQDVVYLKNGSIIRGMLIELIPFEYLDIKTSNGRTRTIEMYDIERIVKERAGTEARTQNNTRPPQGDSRNSQNSTRLYDDDSRYSQNSTRLYEEDSRYSQNSTRQYEDDSRYSQNNARQYGTDSRYSQNSNRAPQSNSQYNTRASQSNSQYSQNNTRQYGNDSRYSQNNVRSYENDYRYPQNNNRVVRNNNQYAQNNDYDYYSYNTSQNSIHFGIKSGLILANMAIDELKYKAGIQAGIFGEFKFNNFAIQPELLYSLQGAKVKEEILNVMYTSNFNLHYLNIPFMLKFYAIDAFAIEIGPQLGFLLSAKTKAASSSVNMKDLVKMNDIDFSLNFGASYQIPSLPLGFYARYSLGLTDIITEDIPDDEKGKNRVFQVGAFVKF